MHSLDPLQPSRPVICLPGETVEADGCYRETNYRWHHINADVGHVEGEGEKEKARTTKQQNAF